MTRLLSLVFFIAGLAVPGWIAAGYIGSNPLALAMTLLIAVVYLAGARELYRYHQTTAALSRALSGLSGAVADLEVWLAGVPAGVRDAVRVRIKGERVALPGPALAPYLAGLLVLLGMLGTFLGMVATLRGTGLALESATDLQAIRASLAAPVQGLGLAFGTSVAGVATSAMLGLLSTLCRRERLASAYLLDAQIATHLHAHTHAHQREESQKLLQSQAQAMPLVIERLQAVAAALEQRSDVLASALERRSEQLATTLEQRSELLSTALEQRTATLASTVEQRTATLASTVEQHTATLASTVEQRTDALASALAQRSETLAATLEQRHQAATAALDERSLGLAATLEQRAQAQSEQLAAAQQAFHAEAGAAYAQLAASVEQSLSAGIAEGARAAGAAIEPVAQATMRALAQETAAMREAVAQAMTRHMQEMATHSQSSATAVAETWRQALDEQRLAGKTLADELRASLGGHADALQQRAAAVLDGVAAQLGDVSQHLSQAWGGALARQEQANQQLSAGNQAAQAQAAAGLAQHAAALLKQMRDAQDQWYGQLVQQDDKRMSAWTAALAQIAVELKQQWQQAGQENAERQQQVCAALEAAAVSVAAESREQASATLAQLQHLALAVAEAPKAAADAVAEVRQKLSDSMARDNAMLEERSRLLETLGTLLDAVNHASDEQRRAVDALVGTSADVLQRVGSQFTEQVQAETGRLTGVAEQVVDGAAQVASLSDAFAQAVRDFGASNEALMTHLQRIEQALDKSLARSDDQLAYYVAQAREVVDLSMLSQKQIIEELRQLGDARADGGAQAV